MLSVRAEVLEYAESEVSSRTCWNAKEFDRLNGTCTDFAVSGVRGRGIDSDVDGDEGVDIETAELAEDARDGVSGNVEDCLRVYEPSNCIAESCLEIAFPLMRTSQTVSSPSLNWCRVT